MHGTGTFSVSSSRHGEPSLTRCLVAIVLAMLALACERPRTPLPPDTTAVRSPATPPQPPALPAPASVRDAAAGPVLVVHDSATASVLVVLPHDANSMTSDSVHVDGSPMQGRPLDLFGRAGQVGTAQLDSVMARERNGSGCMDWPAASLRPVAPAGDVPSVWSVAFMTGRARALAFDSLASLPPADSARLAAEITRLAAALPNDTAVAFRGVPFAVNSAYRFSPVPGVRAVVAEVARRLNQEANPLEQQILLVAEGDSAGTGDRLRTVYFERHSGSEEHLETFDVLAGVVLQDPPRPALVLVRADAVTRAYALLERSSAGRWRVRWTSARTGC